MRAYDFVGRFGGDEFLVVLPGCELGETATVGERMRAACAECPLESGTMSVSLSITVGGTTAPEGCEGVETILRIADAALYRAKREGRKRVVTLSELPAEARAQESRWALGGAKEIAAPLGTPEAWRARRT